MKRTALLLSLVLPACASLHIGAAKPTDNTYRLTASEVARASSDDCKQDWVTGDTAVDMLTFRSILKAEKIEVVEGNPAAGATAFPGLLIVRKGLWNEDPDYVVALGSHELVHYCDLDHLKDNYEVSWATSNGRAVMEIRAYAQTFRTYAKQGMSEETLRKAIEDKITKLRDKYRLWDIDPKQFEGLCRSVWLKAAGLS